MQNAVAKELWDRKLPKADSHDFGAVWDLNPKP